MYWVGYKVDIFYICMTSSNCHQLLKSGGETLNDLGHDEMLSCGYTLVWIDIPKVCVADTLAKPYNDFGQRK